MPTGSVIRFDRRRGYGFIAPDDGGEDVFVHQNNIQMEGFRYLKPGERVSYELEVGDKGMKAVQVSLTEPRVEGPEDRPGGFEDRGDRGARGFDRPMGNRMGGRSVPPRFGAAGGADPRIDRINRKLERLVGVLVEKGVISPTDLDRMDHPPHADLPASESAAVASSSAPTNEG